MVHVRELLHMPPTDCFLNILEKIVFFHSFHFVNKYMYSHDEPEFRLWLNKECLYAYNMFIQLGAYSSL